MISEVSFCGVLFPFQWMCSVLKCQQQQQYVLEEAAYLTAARKQRGDRLEEVGDKVYLSRA
jgi:hypothetical protein